MSRHNGAARTLDDLRGRCVIDDETGCWHFRRANGRPFLKQAKQVPKVFVHQAGCQRPARRVAWEWANEREVPEGLLVVFKCMSHDCINPAHLAAVTPARLGQMVASSGRAKTPAKTANARRLARSRGNVVLSHELAAWVRESQQSQRDKAHGLGVHQQRISDIERSRTWRTSTLPQSSVFTWMPSA